MTFVSLRFVLFFLTVFCVYWFLLGRSRRAQNLLLLAASYFFYGCWDWRFLGLILLSTVTDYNVALALANARSDVSRRLLLGVSCSVNLGILFFFKYFNFFAGPLETLLGSCGITPGFVTLNIVLPVGISFYTFQTLSYTVDVYRRRIEPTRDLVAFATFIAFFPQLVAGPIERAVHLLPQFLRDRRFDYSQGVDGLRRILWGVFKKVVVADNCAVFVDHIFEAGDYAQLNPVLLACALVLFAVQIYGDFSGYTDIAIGTAQLMGFHLQTNFLYPYFARNLEEFWKRWHISLTSWFRDYVYIPLGGNRSGRWGTVRNIVIVFLVSGLWHGANWTFVMWGLLHGVVYAALFLWRTPNAATTATSRGGRDSLLNHAGGMLLTFMFVCIAWVFFRADSLSRAWSFLSCMASGWLHPSRLDFSPIWQFKMLGLVTLVLFVMEGMSRHKPHALDLSIPRWGRWVVYWCLILLILHAGRFDQKQFIYFQF